METGLSSRKVRTNPHPASDCPSGKLGFYYRDSEGLTASEIIETVKRTSASILRSCILVIRGVLAAVLSVFVLKIKIR
jgi:hypothetical protein